MSTAGRRGAGVPTLASDTARGYLVLLAMVVVSVTAPFVLVVAAEDLRRDLVVAVTLFLTWTAMALAAAVLQVAVF